LSSSRNILFVKLINLESCFHKRQVSFLVVKTSKCKRGIKVELHANQKPFTNEKFCCFLVISKSSELRRYLKNDTNENEILSIVFNSESCSFHSNGPLL